jgi:hypothetical protein
MIEDRFQNFTKELDVDHQALLHVIDAREPSLRSPQMAAPARPNPFGYQILPKLIDDPPTKASTRAVSASFSWTWTRQLLDEAEKKRQDLRDRLARLTKMQEPALRHELELLLGSYHELERSLHFIDSQVKYNRFWQADIASNRRRYDIQTKLHDLVEQREALLDLLAKKDDPALRKREEDFGRIVHDAAYGPLRPPSFVTAEVPGPGHRVLHIHVYTDIEDAAYVHRIQELVEAKWHVVDGSEDNRLEIRMEMLAPSAVESPPPAAGAAFDINSHVAHFPTDGAVLTTGGRTVYALPGRALILGPGEITPTTLAHEFGHLFGFIDGYFRGYRDRGQEGFEVLEIVPDPQDIICAPGQGHVQKSHYDSLFRALDRPRPST